MKEYHLDLLLYVAHIQSCVSANVSFDIHDHNTKYSSSNKIEPLCHNIHTYIIGVNYKVKIYIQYIFVPNQKI